MRLANFILKLPFLRIAGTISGLILSINIRPLPPVWHSKAILLLKKHANYDIWVSAVNVLLLFGIATRCKYHILSLRLPYILFATLSHSTECGSPVAPLVQFRLNSLSRVHHGQVSPARRRLRLLRILFRQCHSVGVSMKPIGSSDTLTVLLMQRYDTGTS